MKVSRHIILATLILGSIAGTASAMFSEGQYPHYNMGNMFGQQPRMHMPQQSMFGQMPQMRQPFASPMMYNMMNQFGNTGQNASEYALAAFMNWMMTGQPHYLQGAIRNTVRSLSAHYYPEKLKNIWWTRVIIDTVLARLTTVGVTKVMTWFTSSEKAEDTE